MHLCSTFIEGTNNNVSHRIDKGWAEYAAEQMPALVVSIARPPHRASADPKATAIVCSVRVGLVGKRSTKKKNDSPVRTWCLCLHSPLATTRSTTSPHCSRCHDTPHASKGKHIYTSLSCCVRPYPASITLRSGVRVSAAESSMTVIFGRPVGASV